MKTEKLWTSNCKHEYSFTFQGKPYLVHSVVRLNEEGRCYLGALKNEVILTECFTTPYGTLCWKYQFKSVELAKGITNVSTDRTPDELIEEIITPATSGYAEREIFGVDAPSYTSGRKVQKSDWEIQEVRTGWVVFILVCILALILKSWTLRFLIWNIAGWYFGAYRSFYIKAYTSYVHDEDTELLKEKYKTFYK